MGIGRRALRATAATILATALLALTAVTSHAAAPAPPGEGHSTDCLRPAALAADAEAAFACLHGGAAGSTTAPGPSEPTAPLLPGGQDGCSVSGVDDRCETWSTQFQDDSAGASSAQFPTGVAASPDGRTVYLASKDVTGSGFDSKSRWAIVAYDSATGAQQWIARWGDPNDYSFPVAIVADADGVYATGTTRHAFDDPDGHLTTIAFSAADGSVLWRATYDGPANGTDNGTHIALDPRGKYVYVVGVSSGSSNADLDYVVLSYETATGRQSWATRWAGIGTGGVDSPFGMAISPNGHTIFATGWSAGPGDYNVDYGTIAVAADGPNAGTLLWQARYDRAGAHAPDEAFALGVSPNGDQVFVTGLSDNVPDGPPFSVNYDYATVAYDAASGAQLWDAHKQWDGTNFDASNAVTAGPNGSVYVTGQVTDTSTRDLDFGTVAYDSAGRELWSDRYGTTGYDLELGNAIAAAPDGSAVYVTGISSSSKTRYLFASQTQAGDEVTLGYNSATGAREWTARYNTTGYDFDNGEEMTLSRDGSMLFTTGTFKHNISTAQNFYDAGVLAYTVAEPMPPPREKETTVAFTDRSATGGQYSDGTLFEVRVTDADGAPVSDADVTFTLAGGGSSRSFTATTDDNGVASTSPTLSEKPGAYEVAASYDGEPGSYQSSQTSIPFTVAREDASVTLDVQGNGSNRTLSARLSDADSSAAIAGRTIVFYGDGEQIGTAVTDANGVATLAVPSKYRNRKASFEARFAGDDYFNPARSPTT